MSRMTYTELQQLVAETIITRAQSGERIEWVRPWSSVGPTFESSFATGKPYRGINQLWLSLTAQVEGYRSGYWCTFNAAKKAGGTVRKGERSTPIFKVRRFTEVDPATGAEVERAFFGVDRVFNLDQCDGVEAPVVEQPVVLADHARIDAAEVVLRDYLASSGVAFEENGNAANYSPTLDRIRMPELGQFANAGAYYSTAYHESAHSTGHQSRLARDMSGTFGTHAYATEEVVAEVAAAVVAATVGLEVEPDDAHVAYVQSWMRSLSRDDAAAVTRAVSAGWKAADMILGDHAPTYVNRRDAVEASS